MAEGDRGVTIRPGVTDDVPAMLAIYNHYVLKSHVTFDVEPHTLEMRREWFSQYGTTGRLRLFVAERDGEVIGYVTSSRLRPRTGYDTSVEVSAYLREGEGGRGIGGQLYTTLFAVLAGEDIHRAYAGITPPNPASMALHERFGFRRFGQQDEVGRKFGRYWDVALLEKRFDE